jgi:hypothetical protein
MLYKNNKIAKIIFVHYPSSHDLFLDTNANVLCRSWTQIIMYLKIVSYIIIVILVNTDRVSCVQQLLSIYYHSDTHKPLNYFVFNKCQLQISISGLQKVNLATSSTEHAVIRLFQKYCLSTLYTTMHCTRRWWCYERLAPRMTFQWGHIWSW